jgi:DNA invertase Pin-like site-specific DNA recombinase
MSEPKTAAERRERFQQLYEGYMEGKSYRDLGALFGLSAERVRQVLKACATESEMRTLRERIDNRCMNTWRAKEVCHLLDAGNSCSAVAKLLNISVDAVKRVSSKRKKQTVVTLVPGAKSAQCAV